MDDSQTILLIEEDQDLRKVIRDLLESMGYWVIATPGAESLPRVFEMAAKADLLVTDVTVPDSDSIALTGELLSRHPDLGAVLISTTDAEFEARRRFEDGRTHFLRKPFSITELKDTVEKASAAQPVTVPASEADTAAVARRGSVWRRFAEKATARRPSAAWGLAAAAVVVLVAGVLLSRTEPTPPLSEAVAGSVVRGASLTLVEPTGDLPEMPAQLSWEEDPEATRYRIRILAVDDTVLWEGLSWAATVALGPDVLEALHPGVVYFWTVAALDAQGEVVHSSGAARFQVVPPRAETAQTPPLLGPTRAKDSDGPMTLRVNDARAEPGGIATVVVRTYAPRGMEQGEICVSATGGAKSGAATDALTATRLAKVSTAKASSMPFVSLESVEVLSTAGDARSTGAFDSSQQMALIQFASASATINEADGPLAVLRFRVSSEIAGNEKFALQLDLGGTHLIDADGDPIEIEPVGGLLEVRPVGDWLRLEAMDERVAPGEVARLAVETHDPLAIASGQMVLTYDPAFAAGQPVVTMDAPADQPTTFTVDWSVAGRVLVSFQSPDGSLNADSAGEILTVDLPTSADLPDDSRSPVALDPAETFMVDPEGRWIALELVDAELRFKD